MNGSWMIDPPTHREPTAPGAALATNCNGRRAPLMHLIALALIGVELPGGWRRIDRDKAAKASGIKPASVRSELTQMVTRKTLELNDLGEGDYNVRITEFGWQMLVEEGVVTREPLA